jgi:osmoprotectant transport system ATP-binding protein
MIVVKGLSKYFQQTAAVQDISFEVKKGETLVLLGTSGSGKTTTLRMINRLVEPSSGQIFIDNQNALALPAEQLRRSIGYVLQNNGLFPHYTVAENIGIVPQLLGWEQERIRARTRELMLKLHLDPDKHARRYPAELSGGQQQRVGLARALASDPPILLMDEPFGSLDPVTRSSIRKEFIGLDELNQKTIIMVTHDIEEAFELGDSICLMDRGQIQQIGTPSELLFNPINEFARTFFGAERLLLEMKAVRVSDIWDDVAMIGLGGLVPSGVYSPGKIDSRESLWAVMQELTTADDQSISVKMGNEEKVITMQDIFNAIMHLKAN